MAFPSNVPHTVLWTAVFLTIGYTLYIRWRDRNVRRSPGPMSIPILGNIHQLRDEHQFKTFFRWGKIYGDVIQARLFQTPVLILNSLQAAQDLMDKRGAIYSDRPDMTLHVEFMGWSTSLGHRQYGERLRRQRKWFAKAFGDKASLLQYRPLQRRETAIMLLNIITTPHKFKEHISRVVAGVIVETVYGHTVTSMDDEYVRIAEDAMIATTGAAGPVSMLVDYFPILRYVPAWLPGGRWKNRAAQAKILVDRLFREPLDMIKEQLESGVARPSFTAELLQQVQNHGVISDVDDQDVRGTTAVAYGGGTETTTLALATFIMTMVLFPHVYKRAQEEVLRVVGDERLPDFDDRESLPYLDCILNEIFRWRPPVPISIPHRVTVDDQYRGYDIQGGTTIFANIWAMTRDTAFYADPEEFRPERWEKMDPKTAESLDPRNMVFGFGRRICPGRQFAEAFIWLVIASMTATLDIRRARDEMGREILPDTTENSGFANHPPTFVCDIRPRSSKAAALVSALNTSLAV